jgi:spermidine synthase
LPALLMFGSGAAALVYQVLWVKLLTRVVGADIYAVTIGVSAFFTGLAIASFAFGRRADSVARPLRLYALLEIGVAVLGVASTRLLASAARPFATLEASSGVLAWAIPFALVGIPALLMGGTLPALARFVAPQRGEVGGPAGALYAANTAGAIAGALLAAFAMIPALGLQGAALAAAGVNAVIALIALAMDSRSSARPSHAAAALPDSPRPHSRLALLLYAIAGGIALGYEVIWSQAIVPFMSTRAFAFSVLIATYLAGLAFGAAFAARRADRMRDPWGAFAALIAGAGLVSLLGIAALGPWLPELQSAAQGFVRSVTPDPLAGMCVRFAVAAAAVVLPPTLLLGAAFPLALRLAAGAEHVGRELGSVLALNTFGGILGTLLTGFVLVPALGLVRALTTLALLAAGVGALAAFRGAAVHGATRWLVLAMAAGSLLVAKLTPRDHLARLLPAAKNGKLVEYRESAGGTVAVIEAGSPAHRFRRLYIDGVSNSGDAMPSLRYMRLQALLPLMIHRGEPRSALVIGLGTGITAGALLTWPGLEHRVAAELLPAVVSAAPRFSGNFGAAASPKLEIRMRDGRRELLRSTQHYDLITLEPPPPSARGVANLYSTDFYRLAGSRLAANGLLAQWLPISTQNEADTRSLIQSFLAVFPHATLWTTEVHEMMLVGSFDPIELDVARVASRLDAPGVRAALREVGIVTPAALLATWVTDRDGLARFAANTQPVTDDRPRIEYSAWVRDGEIVRTLPDLLALSATPPMNGASDEFTREVDQENRRLVTFYSSALHAYAGQRDQWRQEYAAVMSEAGENPYYAWFAGGTP